MGPGLSIDVATKRFPGDSTALFSGFRLDVAPGSVVALVGPSGVGKSSLLRLIAGIDRDFTGSIRIGGVAAAEAPPSGFVFQDFRLLPWLTAVENIRAVRPETTVAEAQALLRRVGLAGSEDAWPRQLSGGMQRRVALARALSVNPTLLLLDEPFVSLDRSLIGGLQRLLADLLETTGATALLVTHVPEDAAALADRAVVLQGRPVWIAADVAFDLPRDQRDPAAVLRMAADLAARTAGVEA